MEEIIYENERFPLFWKTNIILERDEEGNIIERIIPNDEEECVC